ncbi:MAG: tetratricopeptide repeat protein [Spirochaetes bacterium]|nr:tetratricopeptide repeat protein [Spirochaetota bacterium]
MRKFLLAIMCIVFICIDIACKDKLSCKRQYRGPGISELLETIAEQEKRVKSGDESPTKLALSYQKLAEKYLESRMWDASIETFNKALALGRDNPLVHYSLGVAYANKAKEGKTQVDVEKAEFHYRKAIELNPSYSSAIYGLAIFLFYVKEDKEEGIRMLESLVANKKGMYRERMALGRLYFDSEKYATALAHYQSLCADLDAARDNPLIVEYRTACRDNIQKLMEFISQKGNEK